MERVNAVPVVFGVLKPDLTKTAGAVFLSPAAGRKDVLRWKSRKSV
jgi:hypothetical protein